MSYFNIINQNSHQNMTYHYFEFEFTIFGVSFICDLISLLGKLHK